VVLRGKPNKTYTRIIEIMPAKAALDEIDKKVDPKKMEDTLMHEGTAKFADLQHTILKLIAEKRGALASAK